ncbi:MAG TPA: hypothetical protein VLX85_05690 [Stellaceae bacterium]|nr:hypothetical protein [Stellaceae bacterium]
MATPFDVDQVVHTITADLSAMLNKDITSFQGFAEDQLDQLAERAAHLSARVAAGQIDRDLANALAGEIADDAKTFAEVTAALVALEIEKVWNAVVNAIWGAINAAVSGAINAAFPIPKLPSAAPAG